MQPIGPGPLNITFRSDMPITLLHLMLMSKIYVVKSDMKNVIGMSDLNVMFKGPGPILIHDILAKFYYSFVLTAQHPFSNNLY